MQNARMLSDAQMGGCSDAKDESNADWQRIEEITRYGGWNAVAPHKVRVGGKRKFEAFQAMQ